MKINEKTGDMNGADRKIALVINEKAGRLKGLFSRARKNKIEELFHSRFPNVKIFWSWPEKLNDTFKEAVDSGANVVAVAGGDGTINSAANFLYGKDIVLGILPVGTFNLVARDLDIPVSIEKAVETFLNGNPKTVDAGELNNQVFLHHVSIGIHTRVVRLRDVYRNRMGFGKLFFTALAIIYSFLRPPENRLRLVTENHVFSLITPFIFVGNNRFETERFIVLKRMRFDEKVLNVFFTREKSTLALCKISLMTILQRRLKRVPHLRGLYCREMKVFGEIRKMKLIMDGEVMEKELPLHFRIIPRAFNIITCESGAEF